MTPENAKKIGRLFVAALERKKQTRDLISESEHALILYIRESGARSLEVDGVKLRIQTLRPQGSPSERRRIRQVLASGGLLRPWEQVERIVVDRPARVRRAA